MKPFTAQPHRLLGNLSLAVVAAALLGAIVWSTIGGGSPDGDGGWYSRGLDAAALMVPVLGVGAVVLVLYAAPMLLLLRRLGRAGPASALLVALAPAAVCSLLPELRELALVLAGFGALAGAIFVWRAYPRERT